MAGLALAKCLNLYLKFLRDRLRLFLRDRLRLGTVGQAILYLDRGWVGGFALVAALALAKCLNFYLKLIG